MGLHPQAPSTCVHRPWIVVHNIPTTARSAPTPTPRMGRAVAAAPEASSSLEDPAELVAEFAALPAASVAEETALPALSVADWPAFEALPLASVGLALAGKTVVRVRVRVSLSSLSPSSSSSSSTSVEVVTKVLVMSEPEADEVMDPEPVEDAEAALKVVLEKPQERTTSSTSGGDLSQKSSCNAFLLDTDLPLSLSSSSSLSPSLSNWRTQAAHSGSWVLAPSALQMQSTS